MSNWLDSLAIMTVTSDVRWRPSDVRKLWYFGDEGIKRSKYFGCWDPDGITDLSEKEELRWSKLCKWLDNYFRRNPAKRKPQSEGRNLYDLFHELEVDVISGLVANISNFPGKLDDGYVMLSGVVGNKGFLLILVVLSLVYGGIHLATWNFAFASKTEHLLWKIACIDIMATVPIGVLCILVLDSLIDAFDEGPFELRSTAQMEKIWLFYKLLSLAIIFALSVPYALSRIYIVVESFISLRHVPIGVYAAVPWVQAIPHV